MNVLSSNHSLRGYGTAESDEMIRLESAGNTSNVSYQSFISFEIELSSPVQSFVIFEPMKIKSHKRYI